MGEDYGGKSPRSFIYEFKINRYLTIQFMRNSAWEDDDADNSHGKSLGRLSKAHI